MEASLKVVQAEVQPGTFTDASLGPCYNVFAMKTLEHIPLNKIDKFRWEIPMDYDPGMRVPGRIYCDEKLLRTVREDQALKQVANVAHLPGIVRYSLAMPDIHWGYGFPIGGVAAADPEAGGGE